VWTADTAFVCLQDFGDSTLHHKSAVRAIVLNRCGEQAATAAPSAFLSCCAMRVLGMNGYGFVVTTMKSTTWRGECADTAKLPMDICISNIVGVNDSTNESSSVVLTEMTARVLFILTTILSCWCNTGTSSFQLPQQQRRQHDNNNYVNN